MNTIPQTSGIYKWTCTPTGKIYIGSAVNLYNRWREHRKTLRNRTHSNSYFQHAWDKYGEDAFVFEALELVLASFLLEREQYYLDKLKPFKSKGFNIYTKAGSPYGRVVSDESRRKMSESHKKRKFARATKAPKIRRFIVTDPDGYSQTVVSLTAFCIEHGLVVRRLAAVGRGNANHYHGWMCRRVGIEDRVDAENTCREAGGSPA